MKKRIKLITALLSLFLFAFTACENPFVTFFEDVESEAEESSSDSKKLAYIRLMVVEPGAQVSESMYASRPIVAAVSSSAFSDITFNGTKTDGSATIPQVSAANFTELGQQEITLLTGTWNFSLEAYLGKTASFPGEKYIASLTNKEIVEGSNQLRMRLEIDPASYANPGDAALHPGSWSATLTIPATSNIDTIKVYLFNYADYVQSGVNLTTLKASAPYSVTLVRGTDFTSTTATAGESSRAMGNYIVYIEYYKNVSQQAGELAASGQTTVGQQLLSTWGEFMRINPGASSQGTIELSDTDQVYSIVYSMPDSDGDGTDEVVPWNTSSTDAVPLFYTQRSGGAAGVITLPPASALNLPTGYTFAGWYKDSSYNDGPYTQFNVTDAENKSFYAKFNSPYVYELYISASPDGDDISGDGSRAHPYASLRKALESFPNATLTDPNSGEFGNTVYILSDYTITQGCNTGNLVYANIVGRKGGIAAERVTFVCQTPSPNGSAFYVQNSQKIKMKNIDFCTLGYNGAAINFTTTEFSNANQYAAINITPGTEFTLENSTMEHLVGKDVSAISVDGKCTLKNVAIKNNFTVNTKPEDQNPWGCSVFVKQGELHVSGATSVIQNKLYSSATSYIDDSGVWIGHSDGSATGTYYHPIVVDSELTGSIVVTPYNYPGPGPTPVTIAQAASGYTEFNAVTAKTKFVNNNSDYNINSYTGNVVALFNNITTNPNTFYVSGSDVSPAGASEAAGGDGSSLHPFDTLQAALDAIATENDSSVEYTIHVSGTVNGNTSISTVSAAKLYIEGVSSASSILSGNDTAQVLNIQGGAYPIDITNLTIQHGNSENGGGIYIHGYNSLQPAVTISNCVIKSNTATNGAGLYVDNGAFVTITDTEISGNTGAYGGGIAVTGDSIINLGDGVAVKGNTGGTNGGGIYISSGTVCMYDSAVVGEAGTGVAGSASDAHSNSSNQGGGIYVNGGASNKAYLKLGYEATQSGTFTETTLTGGVYRNYSSGSGGGIYLYSTNTTDPSSVIFKTGNIVGNAAVSNGGGIYVIDKIDLSLYGGTISGNESVNGGAIAVNKSSNYSQYVKLKGGISIPAGTEQKNDIYINTEKNCKLTIDGNLTATESLLITPKTYTENAPILIDGTGAVADNYTKFAVKDEPTGSSWRISNTGLLVPQGSDSIPLTLEAVSSAATVSFLNKATGPVTYKVNGGAAVEIASGTTGTIELAAAGDKVEFYGNNAAYGVSASSNSSKISCTADCYVYGNIMSLINSSSYGDLTELTQTYTFAYLFVGNSKIKNKTGANLLLPATTLANYCYYQMFNGCTGLTAAPELPATTLAAYCYEYMFKGCIGLTAAPELPATTLANHCYRYMFYGCTGFTSAPELPATTLANYCYENMFKDCTGLTSAPELPAATLASYCYQSMFYGCTGLTSAPELPATTLANYCYNQMFNGCTQLTAAPELPATTLATDCYNGMFYGCTNLNSVTCLATDIPASNCVNNWLSGVASTGTFTKAPAMTDWTLNSASGIPSGWTVQDKPVPLTLEAVSGAATVTFTNKASGPVTYKVNGGAAHTIASGFSEAINLSAAGDKVEFFGDNAKYGASSLADCSKIECSAYCYVYGNIMSLVDSDDFASADTLTEDYTFAELFYNNSWIMKKTNSALRLSATTLTNYCYYFMFEGCTSLAAAPELPATTLANKCYSGMFFGCTNLAAAPALTATTLAESCYSYMFNGCTGLTAAPVLSVTTLAAKCYQYMFKGCTNLATAPALPATTLADYCYNNMFNGCTSITTAPELPATTLKNACYSNMFEGCTNLATAPALPATTLASTCYNCMFKGCTSLTAAPELPATTLTTYCYKAMFEGCTNLNSVTCLATSISATDCTLDWLSNVASAGVFTKASDADWSIKTGASGIPSGWTISGGVTLENVTLTSASFNGSTTTGSTVVFTTGRNLGTIKSLIVSDHETTQGEYETYCNYGGTAPSDDYGDGEYYPAYNVSWYDAIIYCNLRSIHDGYNEVYSVGGITDPTHWTGIVGNSTSGYCAPSSCAWDVVIDDSKNGWRLPYEAEWEYIWREKNLTGTGQHTYCGGENINDLSWNDSNSSSSSHIVKTKDPNSLDIYDMCGNVWEWMNDWHSYPVPASAPITGVAYVNADPQAHVTRGGGWRSDPTDLTATRARNNSGNNARYNDLGFRVVRNAETTTTAYPKDSGYVGTKAPDDTKAVGDIVFNDGSAMAYADFTGLSTAVKNEKKKKAIALIFYKGTGLNSGSDTSERTLGVGIKNLMYIPSSLTGDEAVYTLAWCTTDAKAYDISVTSIECESTDRSSASGIITGDKDGSDNLEQIAAFLNNQSLENDTGVGVNSTKTPAEAAALYPAFYFAKNYKNQLIGSETVSRILSGSDFEDGWYFPSVAEVQYIYKNGIAASKVFDLNAANQALGGTSFIGSSESCEYVYASSTQEERDDYTSSYSRIKFTTLSPYAGAVGSMGLINKTTKVDCICAIREF